GDIDVSLNGTGALVSGDMSQVTLDGDINVVSVQDSEGVFSSAFANSLCDAEMILLHIINFWDECYERKIFVWFIGFAIN
ncbi:hypothetical protein ONK27_27300, partial [Salmonella enterica subsp. enterica serovar Virginia]|nr:hypothetical protein [Salmonella enterica subsp. enterica serovar Virginia]